MTHTSDPAQPSPQNLESSNEPKCWACRSRIESGQKYCTKCSNWQCGIRKHINITQTVLSLLIALIAVTGGAAKSIIESLRGDPPPNLYIFAELTEDWKQLKLRVENLRRHDVSLPFTFNCRVFGHAKQIGNDRMRFYSDSPVLLRGDKSLEVTYSADPKTKILGIDDFSEVPMSGLNCTGILGGNDSNIKVTVVLNNDRSIKYSLDEI